MEDYVNSIQGLIECRNIFFGRTINQFRPAERVSVYNQFSLNERMYLELMFRTLNQEIRMAQTNPQLVLNIPSNFLDSVQVTATAQQITNALENLEGGPHGNCAICQDIINANGTRIRHCSHTYHRNCIEDWFTMSVRCPVCRHDIRDQAGPSAQTSSDAE